MSNDRANSVIRGRLLFPGRAEGALLRLTAPLSFWGGVDPASGLIIAPRHPECGRSVAGHILALAEPIGSSSSSSVLLELIHAGKAPAAILLGAVDAILVIGCIAAREMSMTAPPVIEFDQTAMANFAAGRYRVDGDCVTPI